MEHKEKWKAVMFLASEELRKKIRRLAKKQGKNISDYLRDLLTKEVE